jgi:diguanylate cyclase (GGDEF)-like protein
MRVLVADQDLTHRSSIAAVLQESGHTVQETLSGREAIELCRKKCPDLLLIEYQLADQAGLDIVRQVRQLGGHATWVPILLLGKTITDVERLAGITAGADDVLAKPVSEGQLKLKVSSALRLLNLKEEVFKVAHELVVANRALQSVVTQDLLTGLCNSNTFDEALEKAWNRAKQDPKPLGVILLNLDFFQQFNQEYGPQEGDKALKQVAEVIKQNVPDADCVVARMVGETFAVLLPNLTSSAALATAEKMRHAIEALNIPHKHSGCSDRVTASFGVAVAEGTHYTSHADLKDAADFGLYQAKHYGRNRAYLVSATETIK